MIEKKIIKLEEGSEENNDSSASGSIVKLVSSLREVHYSFRKNCIINFKWNSLFFIIFYFRQKIILKTLKKTAKKIGK